ncbi:MAG TPA: winged helix-turn-helix domain-containing protein, partial [Pyrinomonadaceae bacterium]
GPYQLDLSKRVLSRNGETISLTPKATEILVMLVTNAGQLVERDELLRQVWPDTFVEEANLSQNIFLLRRALGDERAGPRFIETVARRGYRFIADVNVVGGNGQRDLEPNAASMAPRPVVAVLPFLNTTGDSELEYLADGVTDNLINNLSRVSQLRVMSHSSIGRYKAKTVDPQQVGKDLGASAVLVGRIHSRRSAIGVSVELVEVSTGWQLWGASFDSDSKDLLEIQDAITRHVLATLKLKLTGEEERQITARYTENAEAYQSYLEGRYHWSRYTRKGIEKAIGHFRTAIELDPNYALAYAAIVDCYLRLATNYLPPEDDVPSCVENPIAEPNASSKDESEQRVKLRFEWDWKGVERELRRANELKTNYPTAHQWYAAYHISEQLYEESLRKNTRNQSAISVRDAGSLPRQIVSLELTPSEQVQVYCAISREQIDVGNYEAACRILRPWWSYGVWPRLAELNQQTCADLLLTAGELAGCVASTRQLPQGQRHGEGLLNGSIALFEQLGFCRRAAEARIELALCYYRQGLFDIGRSNLIRVLDEVSDADWELRSLALIRLASLERHAGKLRDALARLTEASAVVKLSGPWATSRSHLELASTYKDLAVSEDVTDYFDEAKLFYLRALHEFEAIGHHRYVAAVENNIGFLLLSFGAHEEAIEHLLHSRRLFECLSDSVRGAQVNDTLARLYLQMKQYAIAQELIEHAVKTLELTDSEALLAEALIIKGITSKHLGRSSEAKNSFAAAYKVAERCGDKEGAGRALLVMYEEMSECLEEVEEDHISQKLKALFVDTQQTTLQNRVKRAIAQITLNQQRNESKVV